MTQLRGIGIFAVAAATLYWLIHVVAPVAEFWAASAAGHLQTARPISYFERRDPTTCPGYGVEKQDCIDQANQSQNDWIVTQRALQTIAWDVDRLLWSTLINLGICLAPLLLVWANSRPAAPETRSELY
jgi:hypothetical protein